MSDQDVKPFPAEPALAAVANAVSATVGRFQVSASHGYTVLLDTGTGRSWVLVETATGQSTWQPVVYAGSAPEAPR